MTFNDISAHSKYAENDQIASELQEKRAEILGQQQSASHWLSRAFNKTKLENLRTALEDNTARLGDMLVLGVSPEKATQVFKALGRNYSHTVYQDVNNLELLDDIQQTDFSGSRGYGKQASKGYFSATSKDLGDVVLYRGDFEGHEQAQLVHFMNTLDEDIRQLFPEIYGTCVQEDKTYLVMEKLSNPQDQLSLTREEFLEELEGCLNPAFADTISKFGLNISRTTVEYDYLFRDESGGIRLGIPYRALGFVTDAKERMFSEGAFINSVTNSNVDHITSDPI